MPLPEPRPGGCAAGPLGAGPDRRRAAGAARVRRRVAWPASVVALAVAVVGVAAEGREEAVSLAHRWVHVEVVVVRQLMPDRQGEDLVRSDPRRLPRRIALLAGSVVHRPVLEAPAPVALPSAPAPLPSEWLWDEPPSPAPLPPECARLPLPPECARAPLPPERKQDEPPSPAPDGATPAPPAPNVASPAPDAPAAQASGRQAPRSAEATRRAAVRNFERHLVRQRGRWQETELALAAAVARMRGSGDFGVLAHGRWLQVLPATRRRLPRFVQFGSELPGGAFELEGTISVSQGRYIDIAVDLIAPQAPASGEAWRLDPDGYLLLAESRRARDGEVHYFDHPRFGVVVRVSELAPAEAFAKWLEEEAGSAVADEGP